MSLQYWGYCITCHHPMMRIDYPDELVFACPEHAYSQHFKKQPDAWDNLRKEKFWRIVEILDTGYWQEVQRREVWTDLSTIRFVLVKMGLMPDDILKPREQWDYFYWYGKEVAFLKRAIRELWICDSCGTTRYQEEEVRCWVCGGEMIYKGGKDA